MKVLNFKRLAKELLLATAVVAMAGCAQSSAIQTPTNHAECLVCKHNADLACVDIQINDRTPETTLNGKQYYFCSEACRAAFTAQPEIFLVQ